MIPRTTIPMAVIALVALPNLLSAQTAAEVKIPLDSYTKLVNTAQQKPTPAPAGYAMGTATLQVTVTEQENRISAQVTTEQTVRVFENQWILIPILASGTAVTSASVDGQPVQLVASPLGLAWSTNTAGSHSMVITYQVDASSGDNGVVLALPVPEAVSARLNATIPGSQLDVAVIPSAGTKVSSNSGTTQVSANLPATSGVQISWRIPRRRGHVVSRATYSGTLRGDAVQFQGVLNVELFSNETATLQLLASSVTLNDILVDGRSAPILVEGSRFATLVKGRGQHTVKISFQVPVIRSQGPPQIALAIPQIPVSRFELTLPGKKELKVNPAANVTSSIKGQTTLATVYVPMTSQVTIQWAEAIPEDIKTELRANASIYHSAHAEEGVLHLRATVLYEVTRGETNAVTLEIPENVQVNSVSGTAVADWRHNSGKRGDRASVTVFLDRHVKDNIVFDVFYERLLGTDPKQTEKFFIPLIKAVAVHRQRGMVALLSSKEFTLKPVQEKQVTKVGENQLPAMVRQLLTKTVAHTYKYVEQTPQLTVQAAPPERKQGKFDAQVDTLISLGDVTMKGSATIEINVKSGGIMSLELGFPNDVNLLSLTGPSLRTHKVNPGADGQTIDVHFTQEMEGQFRLDANYERILADGASDVAVPTLSVGGAEVEQGRIAVEALTAVEVQASKTEQLSSLDVNELPQQLILKTTNPILLGYKYVHTEPPYQLALRITRHREIAVQDATIDEAHYRTLFTRDGLAVTTARYVVRNSRKQFLKVELPDDFQIWSVFVDGKAEKPALKGGHKEGQEGQEGQEPNSVLIKIINSTQGFVVDIIYATVVDKVGSLGTLSHTLPRPDMVVTQTHWDVYLPDGVSYGTPESNMEVLQKGIRVSRDTMAAEVAEATGGQQAGALKITVPTSGILFSFEKLYANQSEKKAGFSIPYSSMGGTMVADALAGLGTLLLWLGVALLIRRHRQQRIAAIVLVVAGLGLLVICLGYFGTGLTAAIVLSLLAAVAAVIYLIVIRRKRAGATPVAPDPERAPEEPVRDNPEPGRDPDQG